jgi:hypothetical protein
MIKIDDAGWGSLIGGVIYGAIREETGEFVFEEVPPEFFQGEAYKQKLYLIEAGAIAGKLLDRLGAPKDEPILICTGHCLDGIARWLQADEFNFKRGKIEGALQLKIETALMHNLEFKYGFKIDYETLTDISKKGLFWWKNIQWLKNGNVNGKADPKKFKHCKTGWATFNIWSKYPYSEAKERAKQFKIQRSRLIKE